MKTAEEWSLTIYEIVVECDLAQGLPRVTKRIRDIQIEELEEAEKICNKVNQNALYNYEEASASAVYFKLQDFINEMKMAEDKVKIDSGKAVERIKQDRKARGLSEDLEPVNEGLKDLKSNV